MSIENRLNPNMVVSKANRTLKMIRMFQVVVKAVVDALGDTRRTLVSESCTELVIQVMGETKSDEICVKYVDSV